MISEYSDQTVHMNKTSSRFCRVLAHFECSAERRESPFSVRICPKDASQNTVCMMNLSCYICKIRKQ